MGFADRIEAINTVMLKRFRVPVHIGAFPTDGIFYAAGKLEVMLDGGVTSSEPLLLLDTATAALVDENSTIITIDGVQYQCTQKLPDGGGFIELHLTKDF